MGNAGESAPVDQNASGQLPMHRFLVRIRAQCCGRGRALTKRKPRRAAVSRNCPPSAATTVAVPDVTGAVLAGARRSGICRDQLNRLENLLGSGRYHCDWIS